MSAEHTQWGLVGAGGAGWGWAVCRLCVPFLRGVCGSVQGLWGYAPFLSTLFQKSQATFLTSRFLNAREPLYSLMHQIHSSLREAEAAQKGEY